MVARWRARALSAGGRDLVALQRRSRRASAERVALVERFDGVGQSVF
jgi:hypothetical protein